MSTFETLVPLSDVEQPARDGVMADTKNGLSVVSFDPSLASALSSAEQIVTLPEWSGHMSQPHTRARMQTMAHYLSAHIRGIDFPGVGSGELSRSQRHSVAEGDYDEVSRQQWSSLQELGVSGELTFFGYSQAGVGAAALLATAPEDVRAARIVFFESAGLEDISLVDEGLRFMREQKEWGNYKKQNPAWFRSLLDQAGAKTPKEIAAHPLAPVAYAKGLAHASVLDNLRLAYEHGTVTPETGVTIINGEYSRVSPTSSNHELAQKIANALGPKAVEHIVLRGQSHGLLDSLPGFLAVSSILK